MKRVFLVEIDTTDAVSELGTDEQMIAWLTEAVADGLGPAYLGDTPVRVLRPSGGSMQASDPDSQWLRFPK